MKVFCGFWFVTWRLQMTDEELPTHDTYDKFLNFVRLYHGEYVLEKQRDDEDPLGLFEYLNTHFFWLVQPVQRFTKLTKT